MIAALITLMVISCVTIPQRVEIAKPIAPARPIIHAVKTENGVAIPDAEFIELTRYIVLMESHVAELNAQIEYYKR